MSQEDFPVKCDLCGETVAGYEMDACSVCGLLRCDGCRDCGDVCDTCREKAKAAEVTKGETKGERR